MRSNKFLASRNRHLKRYSHYLWAGVLRENQGLLRTRGWSVSPSSASTEQCRVGIQGKSGGYNDCLLLHPYGFLKWLPHNQQVLTSPLLDFDVLMFCNVRDWLCGPRENQCPAWPSDCCPLTPLCIAGVWRSSEQVAAGQEARMWVPFSVWCVPVLLHHDRVQCVHFRELAHVWGTLIYQATHQGSVPSFLCNTRPGCTPSHRGPQGRGFHLSCAVHQPPHLPQWLRLSLPLPSFTSSCYPCHPASLAHLFLPPSCEDFYHSPEFSSSRTVTEILENWLLTGPSQTKLITIPPTFLSYWMKD